MKILHFSDIHIGKKLGETDLNGEYRAVLDEIVQHADSFGAELVAISGDLIERDADKRAEAALISGLLKLSENGRRPVIALAGSCDDKERLTVLKDALAASNIFVITEPNEKLPANGKIINSGKGYIVLETASGTAAVGFLPYFESGTDYRTAAEKYIETASKGFSDKHINIFAAYIGIEGAVCDDGRESLPQSVLPEAANYTALGGSHKIQLIDHGRSVIYSGSLIGDAFEETKNKEKNLKKIVAVTVEKDKEVEKNIIKLAASKPLVKLTATSAAQAIAALPEAEGCLVSLNLNMSAPLSVVEYKSIRAAHSGIAEIRLDMPPKVVKERHRILNAGGAAEFFRSYYRTRFDAEPPREIAQAFSRIAKNVEFNVNGNACLDEVELKNLLTQNGKRAAEVFSRVFYLDEFCRSVLRAVREAEDAARKEYEEVAETGLLTADLEDAEAELQEAAAQRERAAVAKDILPHFETAVTLEKDFKEGAQRIEKLKARQKRLSADFNVSEKLKAAEERELALKAEIERRHAEYEKGVSELRALEKELALTERTIDMQLRTIEKPAVPAEAVSLLSRAVVQEELIKIYTERLTRAEKKLRETEAAMENAQKNLSVFTKAEQDLAAAAADTRKNILAFAPGEEEPSQVPGVLQGSHNAIEASIRRAKEIAAEIKGLIAENETQTGLLKQTLEEISEQSRLKKQQQDLISGTEHRLEKLYKQKDEQIGLNYFAKIANSVRENEQCLLCGEKVRRNPSFTEIDTTGLISEIEDANQQLREAYNRRDEISVVLFGKEELRDKCRVRLEEIVEKLKTLKAERLEILRDGEERGITERLAASEQNMRRVKNLLKTLEERCAARFSAESKVITETAALNGFKNAFNLYKEQHTEFSVKMADAAFQYSKLKSAIGREDISKIEVEITEDIKKRGNAAEAIVAQEGVRIQALNRLRKIEKTLTDGEIALAEAEASVKAVKAEKDSCAKTLEVWNELEREVKDAEAAQTALADKIKDQKNLCIGAMIAGDFKNAQELKKAVAMDMTAAFAVKSLEERKKKLAKQIAETTRRAEEAKDDGLIEALEAIKEIFADGDVEKTASSEYFEETAAAASEKMAELTKGRYNIAFADGFVTVDNFAGGKQEKIKELNEFIIKAFSL